ncbi:hypothetical protein GCM10010433_53600 [Streptomyces pulveraceus]
MEDGGALSPRARPESTSGSPPGSGSQLSTRSTFTKEPARSDAQMGAQAVKEKLIYYLRTHATGTPVRCRHARRMWTEV